jgi:hypothetical protein
MASSAAIDIERALVVRNALPDAVDSSNDLVFALGLVPLAVALFGVIFAS